MLFFAVLAKGFELVVSPRDLAVNEGGDATFRCSVGATSSIMATLLWEKDKTRVTRDGSRIAISERQKNVSDQLIIVRWNIIMALKSQRLLAYNYQISVVIGTKKL